MSTASARRRRPVGRATARRVLGFVLLPLLNAVAPLLVLPIVTGRFGQETFAALVVAQSLGSAGAVLVELGWGVNGAQRVSRQKPRNRARTVALSTLTKALVLLPTSLLLVVAAVALVEPGHRVEAALIAVSGAFGSLNTVWVFIGMGRPSLVLLVESLPRLSLLLASAVGMALGGPFWLYVAASVLPAVCCPLLGMRVVGTRWRDLRSFGWRHVLRATRAQFSALSARALSAVYIALPVALVSAVAPAGTVAVFGALERSQRMLLTGLQAFPNAMQGWVGGGATRDIRVSRSLRAIAINAGIGAVAGLLFALAGPALAEVLFSGVVELTHRETTVGGALILLVSVSRATGGLALVAVRRVSGITWSALAGAALGLPLVPLLAASHGALGAVLGEASAEAAVLLVQVVVLRRRLVRMRAEQSRVPGDDHPTPEEKQ